MTMSSLEMMESLTIIPSELDFVTLSEIVRLLDYLVEESSNRITSDILLQKTLSIYNNVLNGFEYLLGIDDYPSEATATVRTMICTLSNFIQNKKIYDQKPIEFIESNLRMIFSSFGEKDLNEVTLPLTPFEKYLTIPTVKVSLLSNSNNAEIGIISLNPFILEDKVLAEPVSIDFTGTCDNNVCVIDILFEHFNVVEYASEAPTNYTQCTAGIESTKEIYCSNGFAVNVTCDGTENGIKNFTCPYVETFPICNVVTTEFSTTEFCSVISDLSNGNQTTCRCSLTDNLFEFNTNRRLLQQVQSLFYIYPFVKEIYHNNELSSIPTFSPTVRPTEDKPYPIIIFKIRSVIDIKGITADTLDKNDKLALANALLIVLNGTDALESIFLNILRVNASSDTFNMRIDIISNFQSQSFCSLNDAYSHYDNKINNAINDGAVEYADITKVLVSEDTTTVLSNIVTIQVTNLKVLTEYQFIPTSASDCSSTASIVSSNSNDDNNNSKTTTNTDNNEQTNSIHNDSSSYNKDSQYHMYITIIIILLI